MNYLASVISRIMLLIALGVGGSGFPAASQPVTKPPATTPEVKPPVSFDQALYLIRSTLLTLNDANRSGNYTVLRELAAPSFQSKNTAADLGQLFSDLRARKIDLYPVALLNPQLAAPPQILGNGMLRLTGVFPSQPLLINFDLIFENVAGQWLPFGISVWIAR